jgi:hypothetical protein
MTNFLVVALALLSTIASAGYCNYNSQCSYGCCWGNYCQSNAVCSNTKLAVGLLILYICLGLLVCACCIIGLCCFHRAQKRNRDRMMGIEH